MAPTKDATAKLPNVNRAGRFLQWVRAWQEKNVTAQPAQRSQSGQKP